MSGLSRRQFAAQIGKSVGYVQKLVDTGRCVLTPAGKIDGPASLARIAETQGGRTDVADRWAAQRSQPAAPPAAPAPDIDVGHTDGFALYASGTDARRNVARWTVSSAGSAGQSGSVTPYA